jgi:biopolymer transport protein ExbD
MDANTTAQHFVAVMDELKKQNLFKITFDTQTAN